jgi:hypothetical protein
MWEHEGFGDDWDIDGSVAEDLISSPIRSYIDGELRAHGIDPDHWRDPGAALSASSVDAFAGAILSGPIGVLARLVGYTGAAPANSGEPEQEPKQDLEDALALTAAGIATDALRTHVASATWDDIRFEIKDTVDYYDISNIAVDEAVHLVGDAIGRVNYNCVNQWTKIYHTARREAGLQGDGD